jgi:very-short-patch-repair endonuclease
VHGEFNQTAQSHYGKKYGCQKCGLNKENKENFIKNSKDIHGDKYDYSLVNYVNSKVDVKIICPIHGEFLQKPNYHLSKRGCYKCGKINMVNKRRKSLDIFINQSNLIHGNKYDYSLVEYKNAHVKVEIICPTHGSFKQKPHRHVVGEGCPACAGRGKTLNDYITLCNKKHNNKYNYSLVKQIEIDKNEKIEILCPTHGSFKQKASSHLFKRGCELCGGSKKSSNLDFIIKSKNMHGDKYDYSNVEYKNNKTKVKIICPVHGEFEQTPNNHTLGQGCPVCRESKGEKKIREYLVKHGINFKRQNKFSTCVNEKVLPFDFYLPELNTCIEYDGKQHFEPIKRFGGVEGFEKTKQNDEIKNIFCQTNNIQLMRISYKENIYEKLNNIQ